MTSEDEKKKVEGLEVNCHSSVGNAGLAIAFDGKRWHLKRTWGEEPDLFSAPTLPLLVAIFKKFVDKFDEKVEEVRPLLTSVKSLKRNDSISFQFAVVEVGEFQSVVSEWENAAFPPKPDGEGDVKDDE